MIHQFAELGDFYMDCAGIREDASGSVLQFSQDPSAKFRTKGVLLLVFKPLDDEDGNEKHDFRAKFVRIQAEEYDEAKRTSYLYRAGPPNGWDATPTTGLSPIRSESQANYHTQLVEMLTKKLQRFSRSIADALKNENITDNERKVWKSVKESLTFVTTDEGLQELELWVCELSKKHPPMKKPSRTGKTAIISISAILSIGLEDDVSVKRVGDYELFQQALLKSAKAASSTKKGIKDAVKGMGQCSICGKSNTEVSGLLQVPNFKVYTLDKPGSVSGGFDPAQAWRNFPACQDCAEKVDYSGERVKKELSFNYYGFKYLFLPSTVHSSPTLAFEFLDRLIAARVNRKAIKRLTAAEDELFYAISQENNLLQVDLLFYEPDPQSFRPALYVSGLLPTRFQRLFRMKDRVDAHPWFNKPSPNTFTKDNFTFGSFRKVFPAAHGGSKFNDAFLAATRAALEMRPFPTHRLLASGMRWVRTKYVNGKTWQYDLAELFRSILFFELISHSESERSDNVMKVDYGDSDQAERVLKVLSQTSGKLQSDSAAQAAFLVGACCSRIEVIQRNIRGSSPFEGKLKGFRLNQADIQGLFVAAKDKAKAYGQDEENKVSGLLECAAAALSTTTEHWGLSSDEISYFFALGHALRPRFAKEKEDNTPK